MQQGPRTNAPSRSGGVSRVLNEMYRALRDAYGHRGWWPGRSRFEIIVGAILTQNTSWSNVERAIASLRAAGLLDPRAMASCEDSALQEAIRSSGYYRQKSRKLRAFLAYLRLRHGGSLARMARTPTETLRADLLGIWGIGPETADSILLYAFGRPIFVVDAYTHRVLVRHGLHPGGGYERVRAFFERNLASRHEVYNDYHAQIVRVGQLHCGTAPHCGSCPLERFLPATGPCAGVRSKRAHLR